MTRIYRLRPREVEAMQVTRENAKDVAEWCGGKVYESAKPSDPTDIYIAVDFPTLNGKKRADTFHSSTHDGYGYTGGWYILRDEHGRFSKMAPDVFEATYEEDA